MSVRGVRLWLWVCVLPLLAACGPACDRPVSAGYTRHLPQETGLPLRFDAPAGWTLKEGLELVSPDETGEGLSVLVQFLSAPLEKYPHIYSEGQVLTGQEWGSPFPGRAVEVQSQLLDLNGHPGLTVAYDFAGPLTLSDGSSPVTDWGFMQFTFVPVGAVMYDIRFHASDQGQEKAIRKEFDRLVESICISTTEGGRNE